MSLIVELYAPSQKGWHQIGELNEGEPPGSLSHNPPEGAREMVVFSCHGDYSTVERSRCGVDREVGPIRGITSTGFETLAQLGAGQKIDLMLIPDGAGPTRVRFRHEP